MKCPESCMGSLGIIELILKEIKEDSLDTTFTECIELIASQLKVIKQLEKTK